jgi:hypothetical protein
MVNGFVFKIVDLMEKIMGLQLPVSVMFVFYDLILSVKLTVRMDDKDNEYPFITNVKL